LEKTNDGDNDDNIDDEERKRSTTLTTAEYDFYSSTPNLNCQDEISCSSKTDDISYGLCQNVRSYEKCVSASTLLSNFLDNLNCSASSLFSMTNYCQNDTYSGVDVGDDKDDYLSKLVEFPKFRCRIDNLDSLSLATSDAISTRKVKHLEECLYCIAAMVVLFLLDIVSV
jgi:hypothetical protein